MFFGLQDLLGGELPADNRPVLEALRVLVGQSPLRGYLGAWPEPGLLSMVGGTADVPVDPAGYLASGNRSLATTFCRRSRCCRFIAKCWNRSRRSFGWSHRLDRCRSRCEFEDLQGTNLSAWVNREGYQRAAKMSAGNLRLLATLADEFRVPAKQCLQAAESVLDATLLDPLGGHYELAGDGTSAPVGEPAAGDRRGRRQGLRSTTSFRL